ncbi:MAG: hypothetical protein ABI137_10310 [Antricoccus sp.]
MSERDAREQRGVLFVPDAAQVRTGQHAAPSDASLNVLVSFGRACVVAGGLVAAITGPLRLNSGSWLAAYLVLVCGVSSYAIGSMQRHSELRAIPAVWVRLQLICWILGNAAVIAGTLSSVPLLVYIAVAPLYVAIAIALVDSLRPGRALDRWPSRGALTHQRNRVEVTRLIAWSYRALLVVLAVSIPIGAILAHRSGAA